MFAEEEAPLVEATHEIWSRPPDATDRMSGLVPISSARCHDDQFFRALVIQGCQIQGCQAP